MGELIYNFPNLYHGKYEPELYKVDLEKFNYDNPHDPYVNRDTLKYHIEDGNQM